MTLSSNQRHHLRCLAHAIKPIVTLGQRGLTDAVVAELDIALTRHELLKVKIGAERRDATVAELCERTSAEWVQTMGNTVTLFRRNPDRPRVPLTGSGVR